MESGNLRRFLIACAVFVCILLGGTVGFRLILDEVGSTRSTEQSFRRR